MSDGPHRSLKMRSGWKQLAERADTHAFAPQEVSDALPEALAEDWAKEVPREFRKEINAIVGEGQRVLFGDERIMQLESLRPGVAGCPLANVYLDYLIQELETGLDGSQAIAKAARNTLLDRAMRGARQVEEHYCRKSTKGRAVDVRQRIEQGVATADLGKLAKQLAGLEQRHRSFAPDKKLGLDDGVHIQR